MATSGFPNHAADGRANLGPTDFPESPLSKALRQPVLLGLFLPIQAGGWSASTLPRTTDWTFDYNAALVAKAEALGFDLVFALSQWLPKGGYGPVTNGIALDSFMTTAALTTITKRLLLISTIHVLYGPWHPLHLAKFGCTLDHISGGRWGVNIVTGHRAVEHEMFGRPRIEHDQRYVMAEEFVTALEELWHADENFSHEGQFSWRLHEAFVTPKPRYGRPILVSATGSDAGIRFAGRHSDIVFITSPSGVNIHQALESIPPLAQRLRQSAAENGRRIRTLLNPIVMCRPTEKEAWAYHDAIIAHADPCHRYDSFDSDAHAWRGRDAADALKRRAIGVNLHLVGSPTQIVDQLLQLKAAGCDGFQLSFYDFQPDLEFFGAEVLPLMKQAGLRK